MRFSLCTIFCTAGVEKRKKDWNSRRWSKPSTESTSAEGRKMPPIGVPVRSPRGGSSCRVSAICVRRSGDAPSRNQTTPSGEKASCVWVRAVARREPARRPEQFRQAQFHCGKPPPAAEPRTLMCISGNDHSGKEREGPARAKKEAGNAFRPGKFDKEGLAGPRLNFSVGVGADFAVQIDFFMLRCGPFH